MDYLDQWVTLHNRGCTCNYCQPWGGGATGLGFGYQSIMISCENWVELDCPRDIEAYYEAINKKMNTCPCCGQRKETLSNWKLDGDTWKINFSV